MINELDRVMLTKDLPEFGLQAGDLGTVVYVYGDGKAYEVEFITLNGDTIAVATLEADDVRPRGGEAVAHARPLSISRSSDD
jgi:hypothetical protein